MHSSLFSVTTAQSQYFMVMERDVGLSILCYSYGFTCHQRVLKTFAAPDYLSSEDGVVWLWHLLVNLYIWLTISSCHSSIPLTLGLIGKDGGLSTLCHSCGFACQQGLLKTFPGTGYLRFKDGVVWHFLVNLHIYGSPFYLAMERVPVTYGDWEGWWLEQFRQKIYVYIYVVVQIQK